MPKQLILLLTLVWCHYLDCNDWSLKKQHIVEETYTATTSWHLLLMLVTSLVTHCWGIVSHSSTSICRKWANVVVLGTLTKTACASWSYKCSMRLRSWLQTGRSILSTPEFWMQSDKSPSVRASIVILEDRVQSQTGEIQECHWLQYLILISLCIEIGSHDDKPCFSHEGSAALHHQIASTKSCDHRCSNWHSVLIFSVSLPYDQTNLGTIWTHCWT